MGGLTTVLTLGGWIHTKPNLYVCCMHLASAHVSTALLNRKVIIMIIIVDVTHCGHSVYGSKG